MAATAGVNKASVRRISRLLGQFHHILNSSLDRYDLDHRPDIRCHQGMFLLRSSRVSQKSHETHFDIHRFHRTLHILPYKSILSVRPPRFCIVLNS